MRSLFAWTLLCALVAGPVRAGSISITPLNSTVSPGPTFGDSQPALVSVNINTTDPSPPNGPDQLREVEVYLSVSAPAGSFAIVALSGPGSSLPASSYVEDFQGDGSINLILGANSLSSFNGLLYQIEVYPTAPGTYTISGSLNNPQSVAVYGFDDESSEFDTLSPVSTATILALPYVVPEPGSFALVCVCLAGAAFRAPLLARRALAA